MVKATYDGHATQKVRTDGGRVREEKHIHGEFDMDVATGDASVTATRGFKHWFTTRDSGLTVEATVSVSLKCRQDEDTIIAAADKAGKLAESLACDGAVEMDSYLDGFKS